MHYGVCTHQLIKRLSPTQQVTSYPTSALGSRSMISCPPSSSCSSPSSPSSSAGAFLVNRTGAGGDWPCICVGNRCRNRCRMLYLHIFGVDPLISIKRFKPLPSQTLHLSVRGEQASHPQKTCARELPCRGT